MHDFFTQFIGALIGGGSAVAVIAFLGKEWFLLRLKDAIEGEALIRKSVFEIKRDACLEALSIVDAAFSQREWIQDGATLEVRTQNLDISKARACHNKLALSCENQEVVDLFLETLGIGHPAAPPKPPTDLMIELRNAMRRELGFGQALDQNRDLAWIGNLHGSRDA